MSEETKEIRPKLKERVKEKVVAKMSEIPRTIKELLSDDCNEKALAYKYKALCRWMYIKALKFLLPLIFGGIGSIIIILAT